MEDDSEEEVYGSDVFSEEETACMLSISKHLVPQLTARKRNKCEAKWISLGKFAGMAEVMKFKGNQLKSIGIVHNSRVLLHIEEIGYLMQKEALSLQNGDLFLTIMDIYTHLMTGEYGCTWDAFKVYLELKTLGYIVGRHKVSWSNSSINSRIRENSHEKLGDEVSSSFERLQVMNNSCIEHGKDYAEEDTNRLLDSKVTASCGMHVIEAKATHQCHNSDDGPELSSRNLNLMFDVFPPNSSFKKTNPGNPDFSLCISSYHPPDSAFIEALKTRSENIPVTIATVDSGRGGFFGWGNGGPGKPVSSKSVHSKGPCCYASWTMMGLYLHTPLCSLTVICKVKDEYPVQKLTDEILQCCRTNIRKVLRCPHMRLAE